MARGLATLAGAKLSAPVATGLVDRPRLFRELDRARAVWIVGPPGAGKTALAASYLQRRRMSHAWYQLDARDADLATVIHYISRLARRRGRVAGPPLATGNAAVLAAVAQLAFERVFERTVPGFTLVLDDLHQVAEDAPLVALLPELLAGVPPRRRVLLTSRRDPPATLARLRAVGLLWVVSWDALRLTRAEAIAIARRRGGPRLTKRERDRVVDGAEGWVAGLVLQLDAGGSGGSLPAREALFDYGSAEILAAIAPADRDALLRLSVLPAFTLGLAASITGGPRIGELLDALSRRHYLLSRHAGAEDVFRFHPLLRDVLSRRAAATLDPDALAGIRRSAAEHLVARGEADVAAALLIDAAAWDDLERLVVGAAPGLIEAGRERTMLAWIDAMPEPHRRTRPWLAHWTAAAGMSRGFPYVREHLQQAIDGFEKADDGAGLAAAVARMLDSYVLEWGRYRDVDPWIDRAERLLDDMQAGRRAEAGGLLISAFRAMFYRRPDHPQLPWLRDRLIGLWEQDGSATGLAAGLALSYYYAWVGRPAVALPIVHTVQQRLRALNAAVVTRQMADYLDALVLLKLGDSEGCLRAAARGLKRADTSGVHLLDFRLHSMRVYGAMLARDWELARRHLDRMHERLDAVPMIDVGYCEFLVAWHAAIVGDLSRADRHALQARTLAEDAGLPSLVALSSFLTAQLEHERGDRTAAVEHLARVHAIAVSMASDSLRFMADLLAADFSLAAGDTRAADELLRDALSRGRAHRLGYYAGWRPPVMARLCARALERGIEVDYVRAFVRAHRLTPEAPPLGIAAWPWPVEVRALGPLTIRIDGREIAGAGKAQLRPLDLLAALVAFGGRDVSIDRLVDALWPDADGDAARAALDTTVLRLRRLLGDGAAVVVDGGRLSLDTRWCWIDTWVVEDALNRLERGGDADAMARWLDRVAELYRGPLLAARSHAWTITPRERLRRRVVAQFERMGRTLEGRGDVERALGWYLRGLAADDLADGLYLGAARCYRTAGRDRSALALLRHAERLREVAVPDSPSRTA